MSASAGAGAARLLVGAPASGGGKTTFTCGLLHALVRRGLAASACKCGPDYIDPMFHSEVIGAYSRNLDLFFADEDLVRRLVADSDLRADVTIIEGAMGYYDGIAVSDEASAWHVARATQTPAVLLVDGRGRARSIAAEVAGFARFRDDSQVQGVVLNRVSAGLFPRLKEVVETETGVRVYGYVPKLDDCALESRHLGLVTASEVVDLRAKLDRIADALESSVDIDGLLALARTAPSLGDEPWPPALAPAPAHAAQPPAAQRGRGQVRIAVAHDDAFCFYYADALRLLESLGAEIVGFSPLADAHLPASVSGLYLGGGYPELHARQLAENASMRADVLRALCGGMPAIAECGGFMYLHRTLEDDQGAAHDQVGFFDAAAVKTDRLGRFGYITITAAHDGLLAAAGGALRAHEFHYWDSETPGADFHAQKPQSARAWDCAFSTDSLYAGYPHLYLPSCPESAERFVTACHAFASKEVSA